MNKFNSKESLLDFLKSSWINGKAMDADNFSKTWDALVKNLKFEDGYRPEVTITDGNDGTHTLSITKPDGTTASTTIHDGKNGKDGKDGKNGANGAPGTPGKNGFSPEVTIVDGNDGTHTLSITKPDGTTAGTTIHDGKNGKDGKDGKNGANGAPGTPGKNGFSPEVTIVDGNDGTHTLSITKPDGTTASTTIHDGKNGKDGKDGKNGADGTPGISYTHPLDKNSMAVMSYSHTYYPLYQKDSFDASSPFYKFKPDIKVEVNSAVVDAPTGSLEPELSDAGWTKGLVPTSYVITMFSNHIPKLIPRAGNFIFDGGKKGDRVNQTTLDVPIDSLKLPTADGTPKSIADIGFISSAPSFDTSPMFFMPYPRQFLIPVIVVEKNSGDQPEIIENNTAIVSITPDELSLRNVPVFSHEVPRELIYAKFSPSRKSISELPNVFKYSWTAGTVHIPFDVALLQWNETTGNFDRYYTIQSDSCKNVEVYPIFDPVEINMPYYPSLNESVKSIVLNSAGREVMKLFIGDPNNLGLINL